MRLKYIVNLSRPWLFQISNINENIYLCCWCGKWYILMLCRVSDVSTNYTLCSTSVILNLIDVRFNTYPSRILKANILSKSLCDPSVDSCSWSGVSFWKKSTGLSLPTLFSFPGRSADHCTGSMLGEPVAMATPTYQMFFFGPWSCSSPQLPCQPPWSSSRPAGISQPRYLGSDIPDPNIN